MKNGLYDRLLTVYCLHLMNYDLLFADFHLLLTAYCLLPTAY